MATPKKKRQQNRFTGDRDSAVNSPGAKVNTFQNRERRKYGKEMEKTTGTESRKVARSWGRGSRELLLNGDRVSVLEMKRVLWMEGGGGCTTM